MSERKMIVRMQPKRRLPPIHETLSPVHKAFGAVLSQGDLQLDHAGFGVGWACARSTGSGDDAGAGRLGGQHYWETQCARSPTGGGDFAVGVATAAHNWNTRPGDTTTAIGITRNGEVRYGGHVHANLGTIPNDAVIRHHLDLDGWRYRVAVNNGPWHELTVAVAGPWGQPGGALVLRDLEYIFPARLAPHYAIAASEYVDGRPAGAGAVRANFGQDTFAYTPPVGAAPGLFFQPDPVTEGVYLSSHGHVSNTDGADRTWLPRILRDARTRRVVRMGCTVWQEPSSAQRGTLLISNHDGALDHWRGLEWRNAVCEISQVDDVSMLQLWSRCIVDRVIMGRVIEVVLADASVLLQVPVQPRTVPDDHPIDTQIGRPLPIAWGLCFYVTGQRQSPLTAGANAFAWQYHDGVDPQLTGNGQVYDNGIARTADAVRWPASGPQLGVRITGTMPSGKVTFQPAGVGTTTVLDIIHNALARMDDEPLGHRLQAQVSPASAASFGMWAALYIADAMSIADAVQLALDSVCGWAAVDSTGTFLRVGRVLDPEHMEPALTLHPHTIRERELRATLDTAPGLTTRVAGRRNWSPHSRAEIADSIADPNSPTYDPALAEQLQAPWMSIRTGQVRQHSGRAVSSAYEQAGSAEPAPTLLQQDHHIQAEANARCTTWYPTRYLVPVTAIIPRWHLDTLEVGHAVDVVWPAWGDRPVRLLVREIDEQFWGDTRLLLWGALPITTGEPS